MPQGEAPLSAPETTMSKRAWLRTLTFLSASFIFIGAGRSGVLPRPPERLLSLPEQRISRPEDVAPVSCPPRQTGTGALRLKYPSLPCNMEVFLCRPIALMLIHVYKSAGSSYIEQFERFCEEAVKSKTEKMPGYDRAAWFPLTLEGHDLRGSPCDPERLCTSPGWTCYVGCALNHFRITLTAGGRFPVHNPGSCRSFPFFVSRSR